jgi:hypothetical protein
MPEGFYCKLGAVSLSDFVTPRNLCNNLLHNWLLRPRLRESPHVLEVTG